MLTDGGILMKKIGKFITEHSLLIVIISLVLLIPAMIGFISTKTNYDILVYLPEDIETVQGQNILTDEFNLGAFLNGLYASLSIESPSKAQKSIATNIATQKPIGLGPIATKTKYPA